jgi:hypothetical protein
MSEVSTDSDSGTGLGQWLSRWVLPRWMRVRLVSTMAKHTEKRFIGKATLDDILKFTKGKTISRIERNLEYWEVTFKLFKEPVVFEPDFYAISRIVIRFTLGGMRLERLKNGDTD